VRNMKIPARVRFVGCAALLLNMFVGGVAPVAAQSAQAPPAPAKAPIRAITAFINLERGRYQIQMAETIKFLKYAETKFESRGYTVQTLRIATQPFPEYTQGMSHDETIQFFKSLDAVAEHEKMVISIGPAYVAEGDGDAQAQLLVDILKNTKSLFGSMMVTSGDNVNWPAVNAAARVIKSLSDTEHSEGDFHFAALASVPPYSPFFPAAYHTGSGRQFTIGLQSAGIVKAAFENAPDVPTARRRLIDLLYPQAFDAEAVASSIDQEQGWIYLGQDLSPAPSKDASIGDAIEALSKQPFGTSGTMTVAGTITSVLKQDIAARKIGYSGLMLPIAEDPRLADRWNNGYVSIDALLSYSAVCGTGLDTVPLPGDTSVEEIARIVGDVATLAAKWNKPLSARLLVIAGKHAGERTEFQNPNLIDVVLQPVKK
jgi:uncharacterized protein (UPF0210 family)